jgi:hypothetical protein
VISLNALDNLVAFIFVRLTSRLSRAERSEGTQSANALWASAAAACYPAALPYKSSGLRPVRFAILASIRGPISSRS